MEQENATQSGAETLSPAHAGRNAALAQIASQVNASYQADLNAFDEATGQILPKQTETAATEQAGEQQEEEQQQEQQEAAPQTTAPADDLETIVVDGQQVQVKRSQVFDAGKRTLQKEATADKRLAEAAEIRRQAEAFLNAARQARQPSQDADTQPQSPSSDATNEDGRQQVRATPQDWDALVDQRLYLRDAEKAAQKFKAEFKEIAEDPLLARLVSQLEDERIAKAAAEGTPLGDPWEAYKAHGETIKTRFIKPVTGAQAAVSEDRVERKRSTTTVVGAGARAQTSQPKPPPTRDEIIEQIRSSRTKGLRQAPTTR